MKKLTTLLLTLSLCCSVFGAEGVKISAYPRVQSLGSNDLFLIAIPNVTNKNIPAYYLFRAVETNLQAVPMRSITGLTNALAYLSNNVTTLVTNKQIPRLMTNRFDRINVKDIGALYFSPPKAQGGGGTDDTLAFQLAINLATNAFQPVYIPGGSYRITSPLIVPHLGNPTNRIEIFGEGIISELDCSAITNDWAIKILATDPSAAAAVVRDFSMLGPYFYQPFGFPPAPAQGIFLNRSEVPFRGGAIALGKPGLFTFDMTALFCKIERIKAYGFYEAIVCSNVGLTEIKWCDLSRNAYRFIRMAHCDTVQIFECKTATPLITNRNDMAECPYLIDFCGTGNDDGGGAGDAGVNKIVTGGEHWGPAIRADATRFKVVGGQWEDAMAVHTNGGFILMTNYCQASFENCSFSLPLDSTNRNVFSLWNGADRSLRVENCRLPGGEDNGPLLNQQPRLFDIHGTNMSIPYWDCGTTWQLSGQNMDYGAQSLGSNGRFWPNTRYNDTNYLHIKRYGADNIGIDSFRRNGRRMVELVIEQGCDGNNNPLTNQPYASGPSRLRNLPFFNDNNDLYDGFSVCYTPANNSQSFWWFRPITILTNTDGTTPMNFRISVPMLGTNVFTNYIGYFIFSLKPGGSQLNNSEGSFGYYSTTTNIQYYQQTLSFASPPTSPVTIAWGVNGTSPGWAVTNRWHWFNPTLEYW